MSYQQMGQDAEKPMEATERFGAVAVAVGAWSGLFGRIGSSPGGIFVSLIAIGLFIYTLFRHHIARLIVWTTDLSYTVHDSLLSSWYDVLYNHPLWAAPAAFLFGAAVRSTRLPSLVTVTTLLGYVAATLVGTALTANHLFGAGVLPAILTLGGFIAAYLAVQRADSRSLHYAVAAITCAVLLAVLIPQVSWLGVGGSVGAWAALGLGAAMVETFAGRWNAAPARRLATVWMPCLVAGLMLSWVGVREIDAAEAKATTVARAATPPSAATASVRSAPQQRSSTSPRP